MLPGFIDGSQQDRDQLENNIQEGHSVSASRVSAYQWLRSIVKRSSTRHNPPRRVTLKVPRHRHRKLVIYNQQMYELVLSRR